MRIEGRAEAAELREPGVEHSSSSGSGSANPQESRALAIERSVSRAKGGSKATGPRTKQGKQRASRNATKHGVFSKVMILDSEPKAEYEELLAGLRETLQPEGALEELLIEKLAITAWRWRRLLSAEGAEIQKDTQFYETDRREEEREAADRTIKLLALVKGDGLLRHACNPHLFEFCQGQLVLLQEQIKKNGFRPEYDKLILEGIYGDRNGIRLHQDLYDSYEHWLYRSKICEQDPNAGPSAAECPVLAFEAISMEIRRLKRLGKARASVEASRTRLEMLSRKIPDSPRLDRLLRYETSLERSFDRTLSQLERQQRIRLGQPVLPKLEVHHSMS